MFNAELACQPYWCKRQVKPKFTTGDNREKTAPKGWGAAAPGPGALAEPRHACYGSDLVRTAIQRLVRPSATPKSNLPQSESPSREAGRSPRDRRLEPATTATPPAAPRSRRSFCSPSRRSPHAQFAAADLPQRLVTAAPTVATPPCPCRLCPHGGSTLRATLALPARADSGCCAGRGSHPGRQTALCGPVGGQDASYDHQHRPLRAPPCPTPHPTTLLTALTALASGTETASSAGLVLGAPRLATGQLTAIGPGRVPLGTTDGIEHSSPFCPSHPSAAAACPQPSSQSGLAKRARWAGPGGV